MRCVQIYKCNLLIIPLTHHDLYNTFPPEHEILSSNIKLECIFIYILQSMRQKSVRVDDQYLTIIFKRS